MVTGKPAIARPSRCQTVSRSWCKHCLEDQHNDDASKLWDRSNFPYYSLTQSSKMSCCWQLYLGVEVNSGYFNTVFSAAGEVPFAIDNLCRLKTLPAVPTNYFHATGYAKMSAGTLQSLISTQLSYKHHEACLESWWPADTKTGRSVWATSSLG